MPHIQTAAPTAEPLTIEDVKGHLRIDGDDDDNMLDRLIAAAREEAEGYTGRALVTQEWEFVAHCFPWGDLELPLPPVKSVESVKYYDADGNLQTLDPAVYHVDTRSTPARLIAIDGWPSTATRPDAVTVAFTCGYGAPSAVPVRIKQAMLLLIGEMYAHREETVLGTMATRLTLTAEKLLFPYRWQL